MKKLLLLMMMSVLLVGVVSALSPCGDNTCTDLDGTERCANYEKWEFYPHLITHGEEGKRINSTGATSYSPRYALWYVQYVDYDIRPLSNNKIVVDTAGTTFTMEPSANRLTVKINRQGRTLTRMYVADIELDKWYNIMLNQELEAYTLRFSVNGELIDVIDYSSLKDSSDLSFGEESQHKGLLSTGSSKFVLTLPEGGIIDVGDITLTNRELIYCYSWGCASRAAFVGSHSNSERGRIGYGDGVCGERLLSRNIRYDIKPTETVPELEPLPSTIIIDEEEVPVFEEQKGLIANLINKVITFFSELFG